MRTEIDCRSHGEPTRFNIAHIGAFIYQVLDFPGRIAEKVDGTKLAKLDGRTALVTKTRLVRSSCKHG